LDIKIKYQIQILRQTGYTTENDTATVKMERNMITVETRYEHVILDENGVAIIAGTKTKVIELVLDMLAYGWSPEELQFQHPYLTLGQIHSALAYYWDHQELLDEEIERRLKAVDQMQAQATPVPLIERLKMQELI
jgi:uncharacterized protein (DUF433 family)